MVMKIYPSEGKRGRPPKKVTVQSLQTELKKLVKDSKTAHKHVADTVQLLLVDVANLKKRLDRIAPEPVPADEPIGSDVETPP